MMRQIRLEPLIPEVFARFGQVLRAPPVGERVTLIEQLENRRPAARAQLTLISVPPRTLPLQVMEMERHAHSSQAILPLEVGHWAVIVTPKAADGGPDAERLLAFLVPPGCGINYRADTWHHPIVGLGREGRFAAFIWGDGGPEDEEFRRLSEPVLLTGVGG
jgi:ureidoglycolate hydrolase